MNTIPSFDSSKLEQFREFKVSNLLAVIGGQSFDSTGTKKNGTTFVDCVQYGRGESTIYEAEGPKDCPRFDCNVKLEVGDVVRW